MKGQGCTGGRDEVGATRRSITSTIDLTFSLFSKSRAGKVASSTTLTTTVTLTLLRAESSLSSVYNRPNAVPLRGMAGTLKPS